ncbi:MAG: type IV pilus assembly protein PilM [Thermoleophilia bacterium]|jgi:type IV pilus assembly protein PilM
MALGLPQKGEYALDIGGSSVVVLGVVGKPGNLKLKVCYDWAVPPGLVVDGEIIEPDAFADELKVLVNRHKLRGKAVRLAVSNQKVIVRNIAMPDLAEDELLSAIQLQAQEYIPIPIDEAVLDSQVLGRRPAADGTTYQEVLLVAAQRTMIMNLLSAVRRAGLKVLGIDVSSLAMVRALIPDSPFVPDSEAASEYIGLVDVSSSVTTLAVAVDGLMKFTRVINFSSDRFARFLSEGNNIPLGDAEMLVQRVGLAGPLAPDRDAYRDEIVDQSWRGLGGIAVELGDEIKRSLDYFEAQGRYNAVSRLILSGKGALARNLDSYLAERLGVPVTLANPLTHIIDNSSEVPDAILASVAPCLVVAMGLVLPERD